MEHLDEDGQVDFKGKAKAFLRTYGFLSSILPYTNARWEKLSIFLNFLVPKLPAPKEEDGRREIRQLDTMVGEAAASQPATLGHFVEGPGMVQALVDAAKRHGPKASSS